MKNERVRPKQHIFIFRVCCVGVGVAYFEWAIAAEISFSVRQLWMILDLEGRLLNR